MWYAESQIIQLQLLYRSGKKSKNKKKKSDEEKIEQAQPSQEDLKSEIALHGDMMEKTFYKLENYHKFIFQHVNENIKKTTVITDQMESQLESIKDFTDIDAVMAIYNQANDGIKQIEIQMDKIISEFPKRVEETRSQHIANIANFKKIYSDAKIQTRNMFKENYMIVMSPKVASNIKMDIEKAIEEWKQHIHTLKIDLDFNSVFERQLKLNSDTGSSKSHIYASNSNRETIPRSEQDKMVEIEASEKESERRKELKERKKVGQS